MRSPTDPEPLVRRARSSDRSRHRASVATAAGETAAQDIAARGRPTTSPEEAMPPDPLPAEWSDMARRVAAWFEIAPADVTSDRPRVAIELPPLVAGQIVLITGPSGAGKSSLLAQWRADQPSHPFVDVADVRWGGGGLVIDQFGDDIERALLTLSRFGLGEAHTYLRPPAQLSDGQAWRLRLALALHAAAPGATLVADEFCVLLDRVSAHVVARALRRAIDAQPIRCAIVATSHDDLERALLPDVIVRCDFEGRASVVKCSERT